MPAAGSAASRRCTVSTSLNFNRLASSSEDVTMWAIFPSNKHTRAVIELMTATLPHQGSERVVAIVGGSLLEDAVETTLRERLLDNKGLVDSLLDFDKPLGNTGPQINLLHLLGAFDEKTRSALQGITRI